MGKGRGKITTKVAPVKRNEVTKNEHVVKGKKNMSLRDKLSAIDWADKVTHPVVWIALTLILLGLLIYLIVLVCSVDWSAQWKAKESDTAVAAVTPHETSETFTLAVSIKASRNAILLEEKLEAAASIPAESGVSECRMLLCNGHGECKKRIDTKDLYCSCNGGYIGSNCEIEPVAIPRPCSNSINPCSGNGGCIDLFEGAHICDCYEGYYGTYCAEDIDECDSSPCYHGNCTNLMNGYSCDCEIEFEGAQCSFEKDVCSTDPCPANSSCIDLPNDYMCLCDMGYIGKDCHSICDDEPCYNNATCNLCDGGSCGVTGLPFRCNCTENGTYGVLCTDRDGYWSEWSNWVSTSDFLIDILVTYIFSAPVANCTYVNTTRTRQCLEQLAKGKQCEGSSIEEVPLSPVDFECECLICCEDDLPCEPTVKVCGCNEDCGNGISYICCNNRDPVCANTTLLVESDLF